MGNETQQSALCLTPHCCCLVERKLVFLLVGAAFLVVEVESGVVQTDRHRDGLEAADATSFNWRAPMSGPNCASSEHVPAASTKETLCLGQLTCSNWICCRVSSQHQSSANGVGFCRTDSSTRESMFAALGRSDDCEKISVAHRLSRTKNNNNSLLHIRLTVISNSASMPRVMNLSHMRNKSASLIAVVANSDGSQALGYDIAHSSAATVQ